MERDGGGKINNLVILKLPIQAPLKTGADVERGIFETCILIVCPKDQVSDTLGVLFK